METVKEFKSFGIKPDTEKFTGESISIKKLFDKPIIVHKYKLTESKFEGKGNRLDMQITFKDELRVVWTGSQNLISMINQVPKTEFPFSTTIVDNDGTYLFT